MATTNPTVTSAYSQIVADTDDFLLSCRTAAPIEVAISDTASAPTVSGHVIQPHDNEAISRDTIGPGFVFARLAGGGDSVSVILTAWTP